MHNASASFLRFSSSGFLILMLAVLANAQFRASIQGTVKDTSGAVVPEATVTVTNKETGKEQQVVTSSDGFYRVSALPPGAYTVSAEKTGYKKKILEKMSIRRSLIRKCCDCHKHRVTRTN